MTQSENNQLDSECGKSTKGNGPLIHINHVQRDIWDKKENLNMGWVLDDVKESLLILWEVITTLGFY